MNSKIKEIWIFAGSFQSWMGKAHPQIRQPQHPPPTPLPTPFHANPVLCSIVRTSYLEQSTDSAFIPLTWALFECLHNYQMHSQVIKWDSRQPHFMHRQMLKSLLFLTNPMRNDSNPLREATESTFACMSLKSYSAGSVEVWEEEGFKSANNEVTLNWNKEVLYGKRSLGWGAFVKDVERLLRRKAFVRWSANAKAVNFIFQGQWSFVAHKSVND